MPTPPADEPAGPGTGHHGEELRATNLRTVVAITVLAAVVLWWVFLRDLGEDPAPSGAGARAGERTPGAGDGRGGRAGSLTPSDVEGARVPPDLAAEFDALLARRSAAVLDGDRDAFLADIDPSSTSLRVTQGGYFDNLRQLPLDAFTYTLDRGSLVRADRGGYWVVVRLAQRLTGFDAVPAESVDRFRFVERGAQNEVVLASVTDPAWESAHSVISQPWEERPIHVESTGSALVVTDDATVRHAGRLAREVGLAAPDDGARTPYGWDRRVVVFALSDVAFLEQLPGLPGGDPDRLDAVAFTVPGTDGTLAATRVMIHPRVLAERAPARERLLRHELTHVAVGERDDRAPSWLAEGIAEWVSVQPLPSFARPVSEPALSAARRGVSGMPTAFHGGAEEVNYAIAWWAVEYIVRLLGDGAPWSLLDLLARSDGEDADQVVERTIGLSADQLARRGARLLVETYDVTTPDVAVSPPVGG
ncbi:hypothetical protein [Nocardioides sp. R-C-SC26]|uniref:hypothetical protein n=1 Tax=Nocardioides sp. R-C-SC26 TaxID=2870414 RepID=UPI001E2B27C9|nr:hypothetical protein [Nocardioides sp. R-C-SC26]